MGMDVYGKNPANATGEYFRANVWSWRPIHELCEYAISKYKLGFNTDYWGSNDGKGLKNQQQCNKLADALEKIVTDMKNGIMDDDLGDRFHEREDPTYGKYVEFDTGIGGARIDLSGRFVNEHDASKNNVRTRSAYATDYSHLEDWINFLRNCGGFEIC